MKTPLSIFTLLCAFWLSPAGAAEPLGSDLDGLLEYAREHNPELAATRFEAVAAQQRTEASDALPDPVLRTELMDITNEGSTGARLLPSQVGGTRYLLMQSVPWYGKRELQREAAAAGAAQADGQVAASWAELANRIKAAYAMHYYATASERLVQQSLGLLDDMEQIVQTRYANGLGSQQEAIRVQIEKTMLKSELIALQNEHHHTFARLNTLLSRPASAALAEPLRLRPLPAAAKLDEQALLERLQARNPQLQIADAGIRSAETKRELAYANRYPDLTLGVAPTQSGNAVKTWDLMFEINIPLQRSSRRAQEREAEAMLSASAARKTALLDQTRADLSENLAALEAARQTEALIITRLLPQADLTYQSALAGYENGKVDFAMLIEAQRQILKARQQQLQVQMDMQLRLADIERLLGEEL
ncbi:MAG: TolC family protein [Nitrosomonadales bacterium]|nr:TolC family protein [Nitrosomonadales bacterium]